MEIHSSIYTNTQTHTHITHSCSYVHMYMCTHISVGWYRIAGNFQRSNFQKFQKSSSLFKNIFSKSTVLSCTCTSRVFHNGPRQMTLLEYFNRIEPSKEERIQSVLPKPDGPLVCLIPCSTIESANSAIREFLPMQGTVDET